MRRKLLWPAGAALVAFAAWRLLPGTAPATPLSCAANGLAWRRGPTTTVKLPKGTVILESFRLDFNHDGREDLLFTLLGPDGRAPAAPLRLLENLGDGRFADVTETKLGAVPAEWPRHLTEGDFDGDGTTDFLLADHGRDAPPFAGHAPLLLMSRDGRLRDESALRLPRLRGFTFHATAIPGADGLHSDIYLSNLPSPALDPPLLLRNHEGRFTAERLDLREPDSQKPVCLMSSAYLGRASSGNPLLYLGGCDREDALAEQERDLVLELGPHGATVLPAATVGKRWKDATWGTVSIQVADLSHGGLPEVLTTVHNWGYTEGAIVLYRNKGSPGVPRLEPERLAYTQEPGTNSFVPWTDLADVRGSGWKDLLFTVRDSRQELGAAPSRTHVQLWLGRPGSAFVDATHCLPAELREPPSLTHFVKMGDDQRPAILQLTYDGRVTVFQNWPR